MKIVSYIDYFISILNAITKGLKVVSDHWPSINPFTQSANEIKSGLEK